ncbi:MAG: NAD-dependent epimerase/dehydratase family protein [Endomicrobium sp.]|jgi:nucleoside-diphosphate-sugar epimerase|nr:NAD-dependent epimerase/dehydratase family protein [Endomicrobium sp.]
MLKILVTGANGFVGSHIVEYLIEQKYKIVCLVRKTSNLKWIKNLPLQYLYGSLNNKKFLSTIVKDFDVIIHCAGVVRATSKKEYFKVNVENTKTLCNSVLENNPALKKFIFISSQAAQGCSSLDSLRQVSDKENPVSDYGRSKLAAEIEIKHMLNGKILYTIFRPAAVYGPRDKDIFIFFNLVNKHLRPVTVKKRLLQLVYVKDVANAVVKSIENKNSNNNIYYLANSKQYTWTGIGKVISNSVGVKTIPIIIPDFVFHLISFASKMLSYITKKSLVLNEQKIDELLCDNWSCDTKQTEKDLKVSFTSLEVASKITYNWYLKNGFFNKLSIK